jgi:hypothetical protein
VLNTALEAGPREPCRLNQSTEAEQLAVKFMELRAVMTLATLRSITNYGSHRIKQRKEGSEDDQSRKQQDAEVGEKER